MPEPRTSHLLNSTALVRVDNGHFGAASVVFGLNELRGRQ